MNSAMTEGQTVEILRNHSGEHMDDDGFGGCCGWVVRGGGGAVLIELKGSGLEVWIPARRVRPSNG